MGSDKRSSLHATENPSRLDAKLSFSIEFSDPLEAKAIIRALIPETKSDITNRSQITISFNDINKKIEIKIRSIDLTSLRATINSYLRWLYAILNCIEVIKRWKIRKN
ncbi:MAG: KEOPS complex subunit Pcc1 [Candidatus Njordarchaeia archaeon]